MEFVGFIAEQNKRRGFLAGSVVAACTVNPFTSKKEVFTFLFNSIHYFFSIFQRFQILFLSTLFNTFFILLVLLVQKFGIYSGYGFSVSNVKLCKLLVP